MPEESELDRFGREIIERPDDDEVRFGYAHALEQLDPESLRPEFIRLQLRLANLPGGTDHPEWLRLAVRSRQLVRSLGEDRIPRFYLRKGIKDPQFHRGFVEYVRVSIRVLLNSRTRKQLFGEAPIRHLDITGINEVRQLTTFLKAMKDDEQSWRILSLGLDGQRLGDHAARALAKAGLSNLRWLSLSYNYIEERGVRALAQATQTKLKFLQYVNLEGNPFDPIEQIYEDQGIVVQRRTPDEQRDLPRVSWLRRTVIGGQLVEPDRFVLGCNSAGVISSGR
jgi:uncharacterized protein (TIGR02996 family)